MSVLQKVSRGSLVLMVLALVFCALMWGKAQPPIVSTPVATTPNVRIVSDRMGCTIYAPRDSVKLETNPMSKEVVVTITYPTGIPGK